MSTRPIIFISSVSKELRSARTLVATILSNMGYDPKFEDNAATEEGDVLAVLRKWIDQSDAVIQLVGHCYGLALKEAHPEFGPCSHTQYEAHYARQQGKKVFYFVTDAAHPTDGCSCKPKTLHKLQKKYRQKIQASSDLYHTTSSHTQTEVLVRRLKNDVVDWPYVTKGHSLPTQPFDLTPETTFEIISPREGELVNRLVEVTFETQNLPLHTSRWLLVYAPNARMWFCDPVSGEADCWKQKMIIGSPQCDGAEFSILLFLTHPEGARYLSQFREGTEKLPPGRFVAVTVQRKMRMLPPRPIQEQ